jgi:hypothetical protein
MSAIVSLPKEVLLGIFCNIPPEEIVTTCRVVCTDWEKATTELSLWQKVAGLFCVTINPSASAPDIEAAVKAHLVRRYVVSTQNGLETKFVKYFEKRPEGGTNALCYISGSNPEAIGFFIKTENPDLHEKSKSILEYGDMDDYKKLFSTFHSLTIIGKDAADYAKKNGGRGSCSGDKVTARTQDLEDKLIIFFSECSLA